MLERVWGKGNPPTLLVGMYIGAATVENSMEVPQKTNKSYHMIQQSHSRVYLGQTIILKDTCTPVFIASLFTIAKTRKPPKCPSTEEWMKM